MTSTIRCKIVTSMGLNLIELPEGSTVRDALRASGIFNSPGEFDQAPVYLQTLDNKLVELQKNAPLRADTTLIAVSPMLCAGPIAPTGTSFTQFWRSAGKDLIRNLRLGWPIFFAITAYLFGTADLMQTFETANPKIASYSDALYLTWITMTTVGYGDLSPQTSYGKLLASADGLVGIVLIRQFPELGTFETMPQGRELRIITVIANALGLGEQILKGGDFSSQLIEL